MSGRTTREPMSIQPADDRRRSYAAAGLATVIALFVLFAVGGRIDDSSATGAGAITAALLLVHWFYGTVRHNARISLATGGLALVIWSGMMGGVASLMGLRAARPLVDDLLARGDAWLGLSAPAITGWIVQYPALTTLLGVAYLSSFPLVFGSVIMLALLGRARRMWELCLAFAATLTISVVVATLFPAIGAFAYYDLPQSTLQLLPAGSGIYHLPAFEAYRSGTSATVDFGSLQGVVTFPSFHTALALMTAWAWRDLPGVRWAMLGWNLLVIVSTIPIGGHYVVDLMGGAVVWALCALMSSDSTVAAYRPPMISIAPPRIAAMPRMRPGVTRSLSTKIEMSSAVTIPVSRSAASGAVGPIESA